MPAITRIQVRRDTAANWSSTNPVLYAGEVGYITSGTGAGKFKIGDGTTAWNSLAFFSPLDITVTSPSAGQVLKYNGTSWVNDTDLTGEGGGMTNPMTTAGDIIYGGASGTPTRLGIGTAGQVLKVNSGATAVEWGAGMTNPMTTAGDIIYGGASGTPTRLALGTAGQVLKVNSGATSVEWGTDSASAYETVTVTSSPSYVEPTVIATASKSYGNSTTGTFEFPTGSAAGDLCIIFIASDGGTAVNLPSTWTNLDNTTQGSLYQRIYYKTLAAGDITTGSVSISGIATASVGVGITIRNFSGTPAITSNRTAAINPDAPSVTTTRDNSLVVIFGAKDDYNYTMTGPTGYTTGFVSQSASTSAVTAGLGYKVVTTAGAENPGAFGGQAANSDDVVAHTVVISGIAQFDVATSQINYYTSNSTADIPLNFRGNSTTTLNSLLATGESVTCAVLVTNGATPYKISEVDVDGTLQTVKWSNGAAPTGSASSIDSYVFTIIKTAANTYTILGGSAKYA